ncbi:hypothetical protein BH11ARM2_BH11ARM2_32700 [soil metagenome]
MLSLLAVLVPVPVTVNFPATRLENALPMVAQAAGVPMATVPAMANEVLLVKAEGVPLETLMARIAQVTAGEWNFDGTTYRLVPSGAIRTAQERAEFTERAAGIQKSLEELLKVPEPPKGGEKAPKSSATMTVSTTGSAGFQMGGSNRTLAKIVANVGVPALASIRPGERVVFADRPNGSQRQLPSACASLLAQYVRDHNESVKGKDAELHGSEMDQMPDFVKKMVLSRVQPINNPAKTLLAVSSSPLTGLQATLMFLNNEGGVQGQDEISLGGVGSMIARFQTLGKKEEKKETKATPVTYSADSEAMRKAVNVTSMASATETSIKLPAPVMAKIFHPETYDPLSFSASDEVTSVAKAEGKPVVALLPDSVLSIVGSGETVEELEASWKGDGELKMEEKEGWLVLSPRRPAESRRTRVSRTDLAKLLVATQTKSFPSLDDAANYALGNPPVFDNGLSQMYFATFIPGLSINNPFQSPWEGLQIFARLNPVQRSSLAKGDGVPFGAIAGPSLTKLLFGPMTRIEDGSAPAADPVTAAMEMFSSSGGADREPTEVMPQGVPSAGFLTATVRQEPFATPVVEGMPKAAMATLGPDELAFFRFFQEDKGFKEMAGFMPKLGKLRIGQRTVWDLQFHVAQGKVVRATLLDHRIDKSAPVVSSDALPADLQALVAKRLEAIKKSPMGALSGMMGTFAPKINP